MEDKYSKKFFIEKPCSIFNDRFYESIFFVFQQENEILHEEKVIKDCIQRRDDCELAYNIHQIKIQCVYEQRRKFGKNLIYRKIDTCSLTVIILVNCWYLKRDYLRFNLAIMNPSVHSIKKVNIMIG